MISTEDCIPAKPVTNEGRNLKIVCIDPRTDPLWQVLTERAASSVFHSPSWIQVLTDTYG
jgi:hypothetical protein